MSIFQLIKARGILTEHFGLPVLVELGRKDPPQRPIDLGIRAGEQANRPVAAEYYAIPSEAIDNVLHIRPKILAPP